MKPSFFSKENADLLKNLLDAGNIFEAIAVNDLDGIDKNEKAMEKLNEYWQGALK